LAIVSTAVNSLVHEVVAVDWSGKRSGAAEAIWLARVRDGRLVELENGRTPVGVIERIVELGRENGAVVAGLDFAFSFPEWYLDERGWRGGQDVWTAIAHEADAILAECPPPFWGRPGYREVHGRERARRTEQEMAGRPKSVFQIGGAGAVGTGSLRGMPRLLRLAEAGWSIWPFDTPAWPCVVEIYPRLLTGAVVKGRHRDRLAYLNDHFGDQPEAMRERAAGSEDAFDAAVSALVMARHGADLGRLTRAAQDSLYAREGRIWIPERGRPVA
jgi:hypothetical protein